MIIASKGGNIMNNERKIAAVYIRVDYSHVKALVVADICTTSIA